MKLFAIGKEVAAAGLPLCRQATLDVATTADSQSGRGHAATAPTAS
jgi:hypothetical protein